MRSRSHKLHTPAPAVQLRRKSGSRERKGEKGAACVRCPRLGYTCIAPAAQDGHALPLPGGGLPPQRWRDQRMEARRVDQTLGNCTRVPRSLGANSCNCGRCRLLKCRRTGGSCLTRAPKIPNTPPPPRIRTPRGANLGGALLIGPGGLSAFSIQAVIASSP